jgi:antitoxin component HigA of HigAB toxin-antitoxin module
MFYLVLPIVLQFCSNDLLIIHFGVSKVGERQYFKVLSLLVEHYENENFKSDNVTPQKTLTSFMVDHSLTQAAIAEICGEYESNISAFFAGKRNLSKQAAKNLGVHFAVNPWIFLPQL